MIFTSALLSTWSAILRHLPFRKSSRGAARWWVGGGFGLGLILLSFVLDLPVAGLFHPQGSGWIHASAKFLSKIGDWPCLLVTGLVGVAGLLVLRRVELGRLCLLVLLAGLLSGFSATIVRTAVGRTRPDADVPQGFYGVRTASHWIAGQYAFGSFPSGHTATLAGLAAAAWFLRRRLGAAIGIFAVAVAWSRLALGCHHFSDIIAASVWGVVVGPWLFLWFEPRLISQWRWLHGGWMNFRARQFAGEPMGDAEIRVGRELK